MATPVPATPERILDAAEEVFASAGIDGATVSAITALAGARNKSAVAYHFGSKFELLEAVITRHLARFLGRQAGSLHTGGASIRPSAVLFNGGVFKSSELRARVIEVLSSWAGEPVPALAASDLDLAVAFGAAYYGQVRRGKGVRIRGGAPR